MLSRGEWRQYATIATVVGRDGDSFRPYFRSAMSFRQSSIIAASS
jgi:hypothetical protein